MRVGNMVNPNKSYFIVVWRADNGCSKYYQCQQFDDSDSAHEYAKDQARVFGQACVVGFINICPVSLTTYEIINSSVDLFCKWITLTAKNVTGGHIK